MKIILEVLTADILPLILCQDNKHHHNHGLYDNIMYTISRRPNSLPTGCGTQRKTIRHNSVVNRVT